jgi:hypothetical protein
VTQDRASLVAELQALRRQLDELIQRLQAAEPGSTPAVPPPAAAAEPAPVGSPAPPDSGGLLSVIDLSDELRQVYLVLLRHQGLTLAEMAAVPELQTVTDLPVLVRALARQGHLERYQHDGVVRYRPVVGVRSPRQVPAAIWRALE